MISESRKSAFSSSASIRPTVAPPAPNCRPTVITGTGQLSGTPSPRRGEGWGEGPRKEHPPLPTGERAGVRGLEKSNPPLPTEERAGVRGLERSTRVKSVGPATNPRHHRDECIETSSLPNEQRNSARMGTQQRNESGRC